MRADRQKFQCFKAHAYAIYADYTMKVSRKKNKKNSKNKQKNGNGMQRQKRIEERWNKREIEIRFEIGGTTRR